MTFRYRGGYAGEPVATTLPVADRPIIRPGGGLPPFFAGLLPEGHRLTVMRRETKTSVDDELTLLLAVGGDVPGDVQVVPAGSSPIEPEPLADDDPSDLGFRALTDAPDRHAIPGVQAKASATWHCLSTAVPHGSADVTGKHSPMRLGCHNLPLEAR
ncbi:MAG: HipA N-terminal domain-containing protein [Brachybacterium sp.]|nr:HipA N-terminal domain-containing protein [Brachybacterium sp.]